jgi:hypothetical protein
VAEDSAAQAHGAIPNILVPRRQQRPTGIIVPSIAAAFSAASLIALVRSGDILLCNSAVSSSSLVPIDSGRAVNLKCFSSRITFIAFAVRRKLVSARFDSHYRQDYHLGAVLVPRRSPLGRFEIPQSHDIRLGIHDPERRTPLPVFGIAGRDPPGGAE